MITACGLEIGGLVLIIGPVLMMVLMHSVGGDGWHDAGLSLNLRSTWRWYVFSLLAYPVTISVVIGTGVMLGLTTLNLKGVELIDALVVGISSQLLPRLIFAACEELGWRGYLEPQLTRSGVADLSRHIIVGIIWSLWHIPLILSTTYTQIPYLIFFPLFFMGVVITAVTYGQLRKASGTVWTSVLMHGVGNAFTWSIIQNDLVTIEYTVLANIAPEGVFMMVLWGGLGWVLLSRAAKDRRADA